jgi:hypothetical protein
MSREGANNRIDSLKNSLNHDHYNRTALGSATRFNVAVNLMYDFDNELSTNSFSNKEEFSALMDGTINTLLSEYDEAILDENNKSDISDTTQTLQQRLQNRVFKTALGQTVAKATTQRKGLYQDFNTSYSNGASGAFRSFTNGFVQDDEDFFGSRVLYDNVFGNYEDGTESLSNKRRLAMSDPLNDGRSVGEKVLDDVVNRSIYDQTEIIDRVDIEFGRFHGQSMIDQFSMTGSGLQTARRTIRNVMQEGSAYGRQVAARGESDDHPVTLAQALMDRTNEDLDSTKNALNLLNSNLGNRSSTTTPQDGGYVNKAGVAEFIDLINTAGTKDANGSLTGGRISISTFQFQNETISAALTDKIQRHVLESVLQGGGAPLQIDLTLAYPRQRNVDAKQDSDGRYAVGQTNYSILGPNLIEALKLEAVKEEIASMLQGLGISPDQIGNYVDFNVQFRDKKFHPKVYLTDNRASIGTQNLTAPVGRSINQAGSNFETMRFVDNSFVGNDVGLRTARQQFDVSNKTGNTLNNSVTQSLLYRQIADSVLQEKEFSNGIFSRGQGSTVAPIFSNQQGSQVGFAGDIFDHLRNTLDFAHTASMGYQNRAASQNSMHMFMILDQSFMLQLGSNSYSDQLKGEMGDETSNKPYSEKDVQAREYQKQQHKLFDLLINDSASVVVDTKNYKEGVLNPLLKRINNRDKDGNYTNEKLRSNFAKYGNSLTNMTGFELFRPSNASSSEDYDKSLNTMFSELRRLGFTKEAGFEDTDLKQIIGLASGNIEMAKAPRQHAKEAALVQYGSNGPELISYYQGSSNMGLYSLGVNSGENGLYQKGDGNLTNTEMGIMLGRRDINKGLSRATSSVAMTEDFKFSNNILGQNIGLQEWIFNSEEEEYELALAQRHLSVTWNQLSQGTSIADPRNKKSIGAPGWQDNVNTTDLNILKSRLETMATDLGLSPKVFLISERYGNVSGKGITSINVSIDMAQMLNTGGFIQTGVSLPRLNFELTVLQGPSRGNGMFSDSADDGSVPGFVYFVDKDKVVGNGLFTNESSETISLLGRKNYGDDFESDIRAGGRINVRSGQSAHMSSLDIVPQLFATLMGEAVGRFGAGAQVNEFNNLDTASRQTLLLDYVSTVLTGRASQIDPDITEGSNIRSSMTQIKDNLNVMSLQELNETINRNARSLENKADSGSMLSSDLLQARTEAQELDISLQTFNNKWFHTLRKRGANANLSDADVFSYISDLNDLASKSPQLANMIMRTSYNDPNAAAKAQGFNQFQNLLFGSFYQTKDDRTYGGQQGFYRTLLMGVTSNQLDENTASLMFHLNEKEGSLKNLNAYARFKPLEYNPLTNIHEMLYRSIASKSTSLTKNNSDLNSILLESEARDLGDAANLRLMSSIGIGNVMERDNFIVRNEQGETDLGRDQKAIFEAMRNVMQASDQDTSAIDVARQAYLSSMSNEFGSLDSESREDTIRLNFYTGSTKKLSQLPQRIKNAMGARPMYQYGILAQMALERGESLNDLSKSYIERYRDPLVNATKNKVISLLEQREKYVINHGEDNDVVRNIDSTIDDLKVIGSKGFNSQIDGLGAVFKGHVKAVLNQEQVSFILKTRERLEKSLGDLIEKKELSEDLLEELIRVEIIKAGLTNKGLGKMISGSDHMKYSMAVVQLSGTYNDTFLANPLYGTTYKSKQDYDSIRNNEVDIYDKNLTATDRDNLGVYTLGQKEGQYETRQRSVKSSKMGLGGMQQLLEADDVVVQDKATGLFVHKRKVNGKWQILSHADSKRNLPTISNLIDGNSFSPVGTPSLGSDTETIYAREGQDSINYIYSVDSREGNFANNEYLVTTGTLTSQDPSSGQRVEGTDTSALVKGVAMFAGRLKYKALVGNQIVETEKNVFEDIEDQIVKSYQEGNLGGSIKSYLDNADSTQMVDLGDGRTGYSALSSSIHGVYNANNFKSFFWSHGAKILSSTNDVGDKFMLDGLFDVSTNATAQSNAKKLVGALMLNFGSSFIQETNKGELTSLKRSLVSEVVKGKFGSHYQQVALGYSQQIGSTLDSIFNDDDKRVGRTRGEIAQDLLFDKMQGSAYSDTRLGALNVLTSSQMQKVLQGDTDASMQILNLVRKGMLDPVAERASRVGGINFDNSADTQAALITTAVDFMHQLSSKGSKLRLPSDIDFDNRKVKEVLLAVIGLANNTDSELTEDIMQFLSGVNSDVTAVTVFTDITFAYGKDPTGTQSIGKHEAQHLITPFLGDIEKYQKGGKLGNLQHTVASLAAMVTKTESGLAFYDQMAKSGFSAKTAVNLVSEDSDYLFSSFNKEKFLGFYQNGVAKATTINYAKEYQKVNKGLIYGEYNWEGIQTVRDASDRTKFHSTDSSLQENSTTVSIYQKVEQYVNRFYPQANDLEKARLVDKYLAMGGDRFAMQQLNELTSMMIAENDKYQADPSKRMGMDSTGQFLENMDNKQMFFSIPDVRFETQNGEIVALPSSNLISTVLPSAADMRVLGGEYSGFVDPVIAHYKTLSSIFVPGTLTNSVFEKIRLSARDNRAVILSTEEYKAFEAVMNAATSMPLELQKASAGARTEEAFAGKNKYQGFTATGIGNMLMPFGSVVASQTKLDQAGLRDNSARLDAIKESNKKIRRLQSLIRSTNLNSGDFNTSAVEKGDAFNSSNTDSSAKSWTSTQQSWKVIQNQFHDWDNKTYSQVGYLRQINSFQKQGFNLGANELDIEKQSTTVVKTLELLTNFEVSLKEEQDKINPDYEDSIHELKMKRLSVSTAIQELQKLRSVYNYEDDPFFMISQAAKKLGVTITTLSESDVKAGALGMYNPRNKIISLDSNLSEIDKTATLFHELIHAYQDIKEMPLMGDQKNSFWADPDIHQSRGYDKQINLKEWQARSIENLYRNTITEDNATGKNQAVYLVRDIINTIEEGDDNNTIGILKSYGLSQELSDEYKRFTVFDIYKADNESEGDFLFSKKSFLINIKKQVRAIKSIEELNRFAGQLENNLDTYSNKERSQIESILNKDIPAAFDILNKRLDKGKKESTAIDDLPITKKTQRVLPNVRPIFGPPEPATTPKVIPNIRPIFGPPEPQTPRKVIPSIQTIFGPPAPAVSARVLPNVKSMFGPPAPAVVTPPRPMFGPPLPLYGPAIPSMTDEEKGVANNVLNFYKRQLKAETYGITSSLETNFNTMKLEAIQLKNEILNLQNLKGSLVQKQAAFLALEKSIRQKRDAAYNAARIDRKTGNVIGKSKEFSERTILEQDAYIYHAQALNYDVLLAETRLIAHNAGIQPLSATVADRLTKKRDELSSIEFLLNSFEDKNELPTFAGLSHKQSSVGQDAMFNAKGLTEEGMVGKHMKAIKQIGGAFKGLPGGVVEAQNAKLQYTLQQIESTIEMYKKRSEDMQKFSADREATVMSRNSSGANEVDPDVQRRIDSASQEYRHSTEDVIAFLEDKKSKLLSGTATNTEIKQVFEDIDLKIAENDKANLAMAEVFRSPPLGGTDPRLHMYQLMQGVQSLNRVSQMLSDNREIGSQPKMIYSTERGQTATVMAALGVTTYGGGDWDGDAYTAIFTQMAPIQKAIQDHKIKLDKNTAVIDGLNKKKFDLVSKRASINRSTPEGLKTAEELTDRINKLDSNIADLQETVRNDTTALNDAKSNLEKQIQAGHVNFQARARKQLSNYLGVDEAFFVQRGEVMFDAYGNTMMDEDDKPRVGLNNDKTLDGDALFALLDKGYNLIEGIASSSKDIVSIMNNVDIMLGHRGTPNAFNNGQFLSDLVKGTVINNGEISTASPAIGMLKSRVLQLQNSTSPLSDEEKMFVNSMKDASDEHYKAYLQQFNTLSNEMEAAEAAVLKENQSLAAAAQKDFSKRAFINQWIGGNLYSAITSDKTLGKFMAQGNGMVLTEGTFDMTLKTLGKAGGEVLGKTYNTLVGTTFQDAPVITYGRQILEDGDLAQATKSEFSRQLEGDSEYISQLRQEVINEGINPSDPRFDQRVKQKIADQSQSKFEEYQELTRKAVLKSEGTQGFMKNIHQLLRDSIKLKEGGGDLIETLKNASSQYDELSRQIAANDEGEQDASKRKDLVNARDEIISGMASKLGPGPGLKSLINLDYLTNESKSTGLSKNDFEQRFLTDGGIDNNREMLNHFSYSIKDLTDEERSQLRDPSTLGDDSSALLKVARNMTANSLSDLVTSFRMDNSAAEGRSQSVKDFARDHKASLATKLQTHSVSNIQTLASRTKDGTIDPTDEAGKYIRSKYGLIEVENASATFDANRQHKNALGIHLGVEERHMYNEDGTVSEAYRHKLTKAAEKIGVSNEEYTLMFDIHNEQSREQINGVFGQDGEKLEQFTVMNMMRKDIARSMMDGRLPGAEGTKTINDNIGSEVLTTMAQLAANGKLDSQGMDVFSGIYKGVMGNLLEATDSVVEYKDKASGEIRSMKFTEMTAQQKNAYMTKLVYQNMIGSENNSESGFNRSTSQEAKDWKAFNSGMIANSVLELDANGHLGNEFIDALDKAGASSSTGQQIEMYKQLGEEYLRESLDDEVQRNAILDQYLPNRGELSTKENEFYRDQLNTKIRSQMKYRQEQDSKKYTAARNRHGIGRGVLQRSSFMNKINSSALDQLSTDTSANALDLFVPLALTMVGTAISEGSVDKDQVMQLGGAMFTAFQYARTGTIESTKMDETTHKKRLATAQAMSGVFKFKNALAQQGDENVGAAVAQIAVQEVTAVAFNAIATPWLSKQIAEKGLGVKHAPALNSLEMRKYQASHQLAGNLGASLISAVSSTLISGLLMSGMESMSRNVGESIQAFMPVLNAVSDVNETISKRRQQEIAYAEFAAETGGESDEQEVKDYMVMTSSSYDADNYNQMVDLNEPIDLEPSSDGSLTVDLLV